MLIIAIVGLIIVVHLIAGDKTKTNSVDMSNRLELPCGCVAKYSNKRSSRSLTSTHTGYWSRCDACKRVERDFRKITRQFN